MNDKYEKSHQKALQTKEGAPLFQPQISQYNNNLNQDKRNVFDKLYNYHKFKKEKEKQNQTILDNEIHRLSESRLSSSRSNQLYDDLKSKAFNQLFELINEDEKVSYNEELEKNLKIINKEIFINMSPLLEELKEQNESLNREEFILAMHHLYEMLSIADRRTFLDFFTKKEAKSEFNENFTFHPKINSNSKWLK